MERLELLEGPALTLHEASHFHYLLPHCFGLQGPHYIEGVIFVFWCSSVAPCEFEGTDGLQFRLDYPVDPAPSFPSAVAVG